LSEELVNCCVVATQQVEKVHPCAQRYEELALHTDDLTRDQHRVPNVAPKRAQVHLAQVSPN